MCSSFELSAILTVLVLPIYKGSHDYKIVDLYANIWVFVHCFVYSMYVHTYVGSFTWNKTLHV